MSENLNPNSATSKMELFVIIVKGFQPLTIVIHLGYYSSPRSVSALSNLNTKLYFSMELQFKMKSASNGATLNSISIFDFKT